MSFFNIIISTNQNKLDNILSEEFCDDYIKLKFLNYHIGINSSDKNDYAEIEKLNSNNFLINIYNNLNLKPETFNELGIAIRYDTNRNSFFVDVPLFTPQQLFYTVVNDEVLILHNHCNSPFYHKYNINKRGLFSLLQFATIIPPDSIWQDVKRFLPGTSTRIENGLEMKSHINSAANNLGFDKIEKNNDSIEAVSNKFNELFDNYLIRNVPDKAPIITFSGGVDSGYIASRAMKLGWKDTMLVHYSFGKSNKETIIAEEMAQKLRLPMHVVEFDMEKVVNYVKHYNKIFPYPYADISTLPTTHLIYEIKEKFGGYKYIIDGTGADTIVGNFNKLYQWERVYKLPFILRKIGDKLFRILNYYKREDSLEIYFRLLRRSVQYDLLVSAILCRNSLKELAFNFDDAEVGEFLNNVKFYTEEVFSKVNEIRYSQLGLLHAPTNIASQKVFPLFFDTNQYVLFPFFDNDIISFSYSKVENISKNESKKILKVALEEIVGKSLVYRPKSGFVPPMNDILRHPIMMDMLEKEIQKLDPQILRHLNLSFFNELVLALKSGKDLPYQTLNFIWSVLFLKTWLH